MPGMRLLPLFKVSRFGLINFDIMMYPACSCCSRHFRSKEELYRHLSLDVGEDVNDDPWTVKRGLDQFFQPERRELKCEKCSDGATATQTIEIISW